MLKNIDPVLSPDLLRVLAEMGHEDAIAVVDANFTSMKLAANGKPVIRMPGIGLVRACQAVLSVLPLGIPGEHPVAYMQVSGSPDGYASAVQREVIELLRQDPGNSALKANPVERFAFYDDVKNAYAIIQTGEMQPYGNFIFKKGVIVHALRA
jgi:L-fucose mutarotase